MRNIISIFCIASSFIFSDPSTKTLYNSLDPFSITEHLALYNLYQNEDAYRDLFRLLKVDEDKKLADIISHLITATHLKPPSLTDEALSLFESKIQLPHKKLQGHWVTTEEEVLKLEPDEIDLARALLISQGKNSEEEIRYYEATLDVMAVLIKAKLGPHSTAKEVIHEINKLVFFEMHYRFPAISKHEKHIDFYTFLPSVLDSKRGVCLGVSILYLSLAQRLELPLEAVIPPGHIFVRYNDGVEKINIETTSRGVNIDDEHYLNINTKALKTANLKEVIGFAHFNEASALWRYQKDYSQALKSYEKAQRYLPNHAPIHAMKGFLYIIMEQRKKAKKELRLALHDRDDTEIHHHHLAKDCLKFRLSKEALLTLLGNDEDEDDPYAVLDKVHDLENVIKKYPRLKQTYLQTACLYLNLAQHQKGLALLQKYERLEPNDPNAQYYLSILYLKERRFLSAWYHLQKAEKITRSKDHYPKALEKLRRELKVTSKEPPLLF
jgi:regulator of sirC expression with transglutaminase-like and TPR domain